MYAGKRLLLVWAVLLIVQGAFAQPARKNMFVFEGLVYGYKYDSSHKLLKKE